MSLIRSAILRASSERCRQCSGSFKADAGVWAFIRAGDRQVGASPGGAETRGSRSRAEVKDGVECEIAPPGLETILPDVLPDRWLPATTYQNNFGAEAAPSFTAPQWVPCGARRIGSRAPRSALPHRPRPCPRPGVSFWPGSRLDLGETFWPLVSFLRIGTLWRHPMNVGARKRRIALVSSPLPPSTSCDRAHALC